MLSQGFIKAISKKNRSHTGLFVIMASLCLSSCGEGEKISLDDHMEQALSWQSDGNLKAAVIELKNTLIDYPDSGDARFLLGRVYLELGIGFAAEKEFEKAGVLGVDENITLFPLAESWLLQGKFDTIIEKISYDAGRATSVSLVKRNFLGAAYLSKGEIKTAEIYFDEVLEVAPRNMRALVGKARINFFRNNTEEMNEYVALAKAIHPNDRELLQLEASRSWSTKDFVAAEGFYRNLVKHYPSFYVNEINLAWVEIINGKLEEAGKILTKYRKTAPENILVNFVSALHAIIDKNYLGAKTYTEKVLAKAPGDIRTKYIAAMATFALDENEQSFAYIQQYLRVFPENLEAKELLVQLQIRLNKNEDAYETLKDISAQSEKKEKFLNMLASYELKKGDIEQARLHLEQSLAENPDQMTSRQKLAYLKIYGGEVSEGIGEMERALKDIPDDYQRTMRQARTLIIAKKYEDAVVLCHELQSSDPDNMNGYLCEATALFKKGDFQESLPLLTKVLDKEPGNLVASRQAIAAHLQNKSLEKAEDVQRKYLVVNPRDAKSTFGMYILQLMAGRKDVAIEYLRKSVKLDPNARMSVLVLARHYLSEDKPEMALEISDDVMPLYPKADGLLEVRGRAQMELGRFSAAEMSFEQLVNIKSTSSEALLLLASAYDVNNNFAKLEKVANKVLSTSPEDAKSRLYLAKVEASRGKWQKADDILTEIKGDFSKSVEYSSLRGRINLVKKDYEKAIYFFEKSFETDENISTLIQLVTAHRNSGDLNSSIKLMENWHGKYPEEMITIASLGDAYLEKKAYKKANEKYLLILEKHPKQAAVMNNMAWSLYKLGQLDEALVTIRKARDIASNAPSFLDTEADILLAQGDVRGAIRQYRKALDKAPNNLSFKYHLATALVQAEDKKEATVLLKDLKNDGRPFEGQAEALTLLDKLVTE